MAQRRMFAKQVVHSARFLRMPIKARLLYYELGMETDDEGIVEAVKAIRIAGVREGTLDILVEKGYVTILDTEDLIVYMNDWNTNNNLRKDKLTPSIYRHLLPQELLDGQTADCGRSADGQMADCGRSADGQMAGISPINIGIGTGLGSGSGTNKKIEAEPIPSTLPPPPTTTPTCDARDLSAADTELAEVMTRFLNFIPKASAKTRQQITDYYHLLGAEVCIRAIDAAKEVEPIAKNKRAYLFGILRNREADGIRSGEAWDAHERERSRRNRDVSAQFSGSGGQKSAEELGAELERELFGYDG